MSEDELAMTRGILADPGNVVRRLVFADWLDDHGQPERAAFVRLQNDRDPVELTPAQRGIEWSDWYETTVTSWVKYLSPRTPDVPGNLANMLVHLTPWADDDLVFHLGGWDETSGAGRLLVVVRNLTMRTMVAWHRGFVVGVYAPQVSFTPRVRRALRHHPIRVVVLESLSANNVQHLHFTERSLRDGTRELLGGRSQWDHLEWLCRGHFYTASSFARYLVTECGIERPPILPGVQR